MLVVIVQMPAEGRKCLFDMLCLGQFKLFQDAAQASISDTVTDPNASSLPGCAEDHFNRLISLSLVNHPVRSPSSKAR